MTAEAEKTTRSTRERTAQPAPGTLYLVGCPIGNDGDFAPRALAILRGVDLIACEDTRTTGLLLGRFDIRRPRLSYHRHNLRAREDLLLRRLREGASVALLSDAGMPCISDPGRELVAACVAARIPVSVVPGPVAAVSALAASGLDSRRFVFEGFLEVKGRAREARLDALAAEGRTALLYEAPHRLLKTLEDLRARGLGARRLCLAREMTKRYEEYLYMSVDAACAHYAENEARGEFALVLEGADEARARGLPQNALGEREGAPDEEALLAAIRAGLVEGLKVKALARRLAERFPLGAKELYRRILLCKEEAGD